MFRRSSILGAMPLAVFIATGSCCRPEVLAAEIKSGDKVVTTKPAPVMQGKKTLLTLDAGAELTATNVSGGWVGVTAERAGQKVTGWVDAGYLRVQAARPAKSNAGAAEYPQELSMQSLPTYRIEPPDILMIDAIHVVPRPPYHLRTLDVLAIQTPGAFPDAPIRGAYPVGLGGVVSLGVPYGVVRVGGITVEDARKAIEEHLRKYLKEPAVSVTLLDVAAKQQITGQHLVGPDGTVTLGSYGSVPLAGLTISKAKDAVEAHLARFLENPEVSLNVAAYNSKVYYVITEGADLGDKVVRVPITGNETVLDAISNLGELSQLSSREICVTRPAPPGSGKATILPVDWEAITRRGATATNYQIFPRDRIVISQKTKVTKPPSP